ncbi:MAG TPA: glutaredoxin family protein [Burkholderiales bacterium]|nr:glutaredoxin family protein [Burkholderiales bacterium]
MIRGVVLTALVLLASSAQAQVYRWVDENGRVRYTDTPPPASAKAVERKKYGGTGSADAGIPYATQRAMREFPVSLYTAPECGKLCADAKALLDKRGIPHREITVSGNEAIEDLKKASGKIQVPTLVVGADSVSGFEATAWNMALDRAGYPSASAYKPRPEAIGTLLPPVKLYTNSECGDVCAAARKLLAERKVKFQEVEVETEATFEELKKVSGSMSVPVLVVGATVQKGYEPGTYGRLLDAAGFPK